MATPPPPHTLRLPLPSHQPVMLATPWRSLGMKPPLKRCLVRRKVKEMQMRELNGQLGILDQDLQKLQRKSEAEHEAAAVAEAEARMRSLPAKSVVIVQGEAPMTPAAAAAVMAAASGTSGGRNVRLHHVGSSGGLSTITIDQERVRAEGQEAQVLHEVLMQGVRAAMPPPAPRMPRPEVCEILDGDEAMAAAPEDVCMEPVEREEEGAAAAAANAVVTAAARRGKAEEAVAVGGGGSSAGTSAVVGASQGGPAPLRQATGPSSLSAAAAAAAAADGKGSGGSWGGSSSHHHQHHPAATNGEADGPGSSSLAVPKCTACSNATCQACTAPDAFRGVPSVAAGLAAGVRPAGPVSSASSLRGAVGAMGRQAAGAAAGAAAGMGGAAAAGMGGAAAAGMGGAAAAGMGAGNHQQLHLRPMSVPGKTGMIPSAAAAAGAGAVRGRPGGPAGAVSAAVGDTALSEVHLAKKRRIMRQFDELEGAYFLMR
jgi:hypothetical protein